MIQQTQVMSDKGLLYISKYIEVLG